MISGAYHVDFLLLEYLQSVFAFWFRSVIKTVALYSIPGINEQEIYPLLIGFLAHALGKRDVVTPVRAVRRSSSDQYTVLGDGCSVNNSCR